MTPIDLEGLRALYERWRSGSERQIAAVEDDLIPAMFSALPALIALAERALQQDVRSVAQPAAERAVEFRGAEIDYGGPDHRSGKYWISLNFGFWKDWHEAKAALSRARTGSEAQNG